MAAAGAPVRHLVVFVKAPRLGRVKTRLAREIGAVAAWRFYRETTRTLLCRLRSRSRWRCWLAVTPDGTAAAALPSLPGWQAIGQGPGDLGARMDRVMRRLPPGPVVIIGSDIPDIRPRHVEEAFRRLGRHPAVFGPAADGGYWLVGLRRRPRCPRPFAGVRWSTSHALADTVANLAAEAGAPAFLEILEDIDDGAAWARWQGLPKGFS
ncbi:MAG: glycosyltransferase [Rhodospirillales bacterium]|nr:MAG: glycosyltransferase [Rhodospirillales bacterium]